MTTGASAMPGPPRWSVAGRRVLVTGGAGFLGRAVCRRLAELEPGEVFVPRRADYDLRDPGAVRAAFAEATPHHVIHLAADVGGIGYNLNHPATLFHDNALMGLLVMEEARRCGAERFLATGSVCAYPAETPVPFREASLWAGYPEPSNAPYGNAKRMLVEQAETYRRQYDFPATVVLPANLYGPGDNDAPARSHVIPALIRRFVEARESGLAAVTLWGCGRATREFMHVDDAARGLLAALQHDTGDGPLNLGSGEEIRIRDLAQLLQALTGYRGEIAWDPARPEGQHRRRLDVSRAWERLGFRTEIPLREGLAETVRWYEVNRRRRAPA